MFVGCEAQSQRGRFARLSREPGLAQTRRTAQTAKSRGIAGFTEIRNALEPISPELVLVDPELAHAPNGRLHERTRPRGVDNYPMLRSVPAQTLWQEPREGLLERYGRPSALDHSGRPAGPLLLAMSLFVMGLLTAMVLSRNLDERPGLMMSGNEPTSFAAAVAIARGHGKGSSVGETMPPRSSVPVATSVRGPSGPATTVSRASRRSTAASRESKATRQGSRTPPSTVLGETRAMAERKILAAVVQSPVGKLPPALIDQQTGLAKNNLQAVCRVSQTSSFLCVVRPLQHRPKEGLRVRYRPTRNGPGVFTWYRYRDR